MLVDVTSMIASVGSSTFGSGTLSTRTSRLPCQVTAFIATSPSEVGERFEYPGGPTGNGLRCREFVPMRLSPRPRKTAGTDALRQRRQSGDAHDLLCNRRDSRLGGGDDAVSVLVRLLICQNGADVGGSGQLLDFGHRFGHVQRVVVSDRQLVS